MKEITININIGIMIKSTNSTRRYRSLLLN